MIRVSIKLYNNKYIYKVDFMLNYIKKNYIYKSHSEIYSIKLATLKNAYSLKKKYQRIKVAWMV